MKLSQDIYAAAPKPGGFLAWIRSLFDSKHSAQETLVPLLSYPAIKSSRHDPTLPEKTGPWFDISTAGRCDVTGDIPQLIASSGQNGLSGYSNIGLSGMCYGLLGLSGQCYITGFSTYRPRDDRPASYVYYSGS